MDNIVSTEQFFTLARSEGATLMLFSADWCPDCRFLDGFIEDVVAKYTGRLAFYKVDRDAFPELCETLDIMGIPSFVVYKAGNIIGRFVNKNRKTQREVEAFLEETLA